MSPDRVGRARLVHVPVLDLRGHFRSKDLGGVARTLWVLFVIFVPWLGILVYLIVRGRGMQERQLEQAIQMQRAQAEYIRPWPAAPPQVPPIRSGRRKVCSSPVRSRR